MYGQRDDSENFGSHVLQVHKIDRLDSESQVAWQEIHRIWFLENPAL